jgi:hypothetical protein
MGKKNRHQADMTVKANQAETWGDTTFKFPSFVGFEFY